MRECHNPVSCFRQDHRVFWCEDRDVLWLPGPLHQVVGVPCLPGSGTLASTGDQSGTFTTSTALGTPAGAGAVVAVHLIRVHVNQ